MHHGAGGFVLGSGAGVERSLSHRGQPPEMRLSGADTPRGGIVFFVTISRCKYTCVGKNLTKLPLALKYLAIWKKN
jgi:hypothetical protein